MNSLAGLMIGFGVCFAVSLLIDWRTRSMSLSLIPIVLALTVSLWLKDAFGMPTEAVTLVSIAYIAARIWLSLRRWYRKGR